MPLEELQPLPLSFHAREPVKVARALLGMSLVNIIDGQPRAGRIVETEAYLGPHDLACHSSKGRTKRTEVMFGPAGHAYLFLIYGMHVCFNVVTGNGSAVLIRAVEPLMNLENQRTDGPGRLTRALRLDLKLNALPLDGPPLFVAKGQKVLSRHVEVTPRIGVDYAGEWAPRPLRFFDRRSRFVSGEK